MYGRAAPGSPQQRRRASTAVMLRVLLITAAAATCRGDGGRWRMGTDAVGQVNLSGHRSVAHICLPFVCKGVYGVSE